jgi:hypothetical protein
MTVLLEDCHLCGDQDCLARLPSNFAVQQKQQAGKVVKEFIKNAKQDLEDQKKELI